MKKSDVVRTILGQRFGMMPQQTIGTAFAPTNIALCKYWGKRNQELNLPLTSSLSISLGEKGATATFMLSTNKQDEIFLNDQVVDLQLGFAKRLITFVDLLRGFSGPFFSIRIQSNIPIAAGLASSACGFASVVQALDALYGWELSAREQSILARLGSGSASRSVWQGFVEWYAGVRDDGMDCYAEPLIVSWPEFCVGLLIVNPHEKSVSSREAMQRTVMTSKLYQQWPVRVAQDLAILKDALNAKDFCSLGSVSESNAIAMHATMLDAIPAINYSLPETVAAMHKVAQLRADGLAVYFTQDAGPNLKLLFLQNDIENIRAQFSGIEILQPFIHTRHVSAG